MSFKFFVGVRGSIDRLWGGSQKQLPYLGQPLPMPDYQVSRHTKLTSDCPPAP